MKLRVYSNSAFLLRAAIGFSRRVTSAGEDSYSFSLNSIFCCTSCTCYDLIARPDSFRKEIPHPRFFYCHVPSKNEGNLEAARWRAVGCSWATAGGALSQLYQRVCRLSCSVIAPSGQS